MLMHLPPLRRFASSRFDSLKCPTSAPAGGSTRLGGHRAFGADASFHAYPVSWPCGGGPTARNKPAQGNALGLSPPANPSPERAAQIVSHFQGSPGVLRFTQGVALGWLVTHPWCSFALA